MNREEDQVNVIDVVKSSHQGTIVMLKFYI